MAKKKKKTKKKKLKSKKKKKRQLDVEMSTISHSLASLDPVVCLFVFVGLLDAHLRQTRRLFQSRF